MKMLIMAMLLLLIVGCTQTASDPVTVSKDFTYTATGDDGIAGQASYAEIRMATSVAALQNNWDSCTVISSHAPWASGVKDTITVSLEVETGVDYYFGVKLADEMLNWSLVSNLITDNWADTTAPSPVGDFDFAD